MLMVETLLKFNNVDTHSQETLVLKLSLSLR